jgi:hypothetical protein
MAFRLQQQMGSHPHFLYIELVFLRFGLRWASGEIRLAFAVEAVMLRFCIASAVLFDGRFGAGLRAGTGSYRAWEQEKASLTRECSGGSTP